MGYTVLARKWRPKSFQEMVGQEHILQIMSNTLSKQRIHHAYLFCGTRGVGKTTLARIFAKCLNCESGVTATPCNECNTCKNIDAGNFVDLIEIDAASRTKVEDTRELLDNVQYAPTAGRYKVYLIDEVHMLSGHSFNALLKTLEEPPEHVKFLLATTDPQKLPITVLSRCLKLQLNMLTETQISTYLENVLIAENITFEAPALTELAIAAKGSMRDALSLLDQAIVFCDQQINLDGIQKMLGLVNQDHIWTIIQNVHESNPDTLFDTINTMAAQGDDFVKAADALLSALYYVAVAQSAPSALAKNIANHVQITELASTIDAELIQLYYQILLVGKKDINLAPTPKMGFEMLIMRLLAFQPSNSKPVQIQPIAKQPKTSQIPQEPPKNTHSSPLSENYSGEITPENWHNIVKTLKISGATAIVAGHCSVGKMDNNSLELCLTDKHRLLCNDKHKQLLEEAVSEFLGKRIRLTITIGEQNQETPQDRQKREQSESLKAAQSSLEKDKTVQDMLQMFDASIDPASVTTDN